MAPALGDGAGGASPAWPPLLPGLYGLPGGPAQSRAQGGGVERALGRRVWLGPEDLARQVDRGWATARVPPEGGHTACGSGWEPATPPTPPASAPPPRGCCVGRRDPGAHPQGQQPALQPGAAHREGWRLHQGLFPCWPHAHVEPGGLAHGVSRASGTPGDQEGVWAGWGAVWPLGGWRGWRQSGGQAVHPVRGRSGPGWCAGPAPSPAPPPS